MPVRLLMVLLNETYELFPAACLNAKLRLGPLRAKIALPVDGVTPVDRSVQVASTAAVGAVMAEADLVKRMLWVEAE